ncbi:response regulator transcription factor [Clostridium sp. AWRP]|uniref:response regulator transcription factor n=1 Tax=Clostridium sp. AWRP TaxID=2212991 RepID=UPI000FDB9028|nr:response regulator transcription factor [Clostridium sp. AWRP]AZV58689.1 response regulator [Clostridium sp. AWRP]
MTDERILIVDDEERIREMIKEYISLEGYIIDEASDGTDAINLFKQNEYSLIILDVMMPKMDGWSVCREIRKSSHVPVIMLTARGEEYDKLFGFELGVDDYIVKPFSPKELLARMKAIIRRSAAHQIETQKENKAVFEGLIIEYDSRNVYVDGEIIGLTPKEYELLNFFSKNTNRVFSREQLLTEVWGYDFTGDDRTVDSHVKMLRESLKQYRKFIVTVWGTGYKFEVGVKK